MKHRPMNKVISLVVALCLCMLAFPMGVLAGEPDVKTGYYEDEQWVEGVLEQELPEGLESIDKTAVKTGENTYEVTLEVVAKKSSTLITPDAAATVLVLDTSGSMDDNSRLSTAKAQAIRLIDTYGGKSTNMQRYLAVVSFNSSAKVVLDWADVSNPAERIKAKAAVSALKADGGTNLHAGLLQANGLLKDEKVAALTKEAKNVITLTDGAPTYWMEKCDDTSIGHIKFGKHKGHDTIDGVRYGIAGDGSRGSKTINEAGKKAADSVKKNASLYTICYGARYERTYFGGPTVGDYLKNSIATKADMAYNAGNAKELENAFKAITEHIVSGLDGMGLMVYDKVPSFVTYSDLPDDARMIKDTLVWKLRSPDVHTEGTSNYFTYRISYTATLDANDPAFVEGQWYPLNGRTYLKLPVCCGRDKIIDFPIPAGQGVKDRYTITWVNEDGTVLETDKVLPGTVPTYDGDTPEKASEGRFDYEFSGWTPEVVAAAKDATYTAQYDEITNALVTFKVVNGTWDGTDSADQVVRVPLTDGKGTLDSALIPDGMVAMTGYEGGSWDVAPNTTEDGITEDAEYVYTFTKSAVVDPDKPDSKPDPEKPDSKPDPEKPDKPDSKPDTKPETKPEAPETGDAGLVLPILMLTASGAAVLALRRRK